MALKISQRTVEDVTVIDCKGRITFGEESASLREYVKALLPDTRRIVLNLAEVSYIDSGGIGTLVGLFTSARAGGGDIKLAHLTQRVGDVLQITKLVTVFQVCDTEAQAIEQYKQAAPASAKA